jgi:hypothetical protein
MHHPYLVGKLPKGLEDWSNWTMAISSVVQEIEQEIARLQEAKRLLEGGAVGSSGRRTAIAKAGARPKRVLSAAGRKAIAAAQKARWAKVRKAQRAAAAAN